MVLTEIIHTEELYQLPAKPVILLTQPWLELSAEEIQQLTRITDALKQRINSHLGLPSFQIITVKSLDLSTWIEKPERLIYFGPAVKGFNYYELIEAAGSRMVLAENLSDLIGSEPARAKLWTALKLLFAS